MAHIIRYIKTVACIESGRLSDITIVPGTGVCLNFRREWQELPSVGLSECVVTSSVEQKSRIFKTRLTSFLSEHFYVADRHLSFLVTAVDGSRFLIGTEGHPFPVVTTEDTMPSRVTERSGCALTVEHTGTLGLLPVLD